MPATHSLTVARTYGGVIHVCVDGCLVLSTPDGTSASYPSAVRSGRAAADHCIAAKIAEYRRIYPGLKVWFHPDLTFRVECRLATECRRSEWSTTDRAEFVAHMANVHGRKRSHSERSMTLTAEDAKGFARARSGKPFLTTTKAPRAPKDGTPQWVPKDGAPGAVVTWEDRGVNYTGTVWSTEGTTHIWVVPEGYRHGDVLIRLRRPRWSGGHWIEDGKSPADQAARMRRERVILDADRIVVAGEPVDSKDGAPLVVRTVAHVKGCTQIDQDAMTSCHTPWRFLALQHGHGVFQRSSRPDGIVGTWNVVGYCPNCLPLDTDVQAPDPKPTPTPVNTSIMCRHCGWRVHLDLGHTEGVGYRCLPGRGCRTPVPTAPTTTTPMVPELR